MELIGFSIFASVAVFGFKCDAVYGERYVNVPIWVLAGLAYTAVWDCRSAEWLGGR
jgi:hypothetical protein